MWYQQAASLATILATEMEHHSTSDYFKNVDNLREDKAAFNAIKDSQEFVIYIAKGYTQWAREKQQSTTDQVFCMALNFVSVMNLYCLF